MKARVRAAAGETPNARENRRTSVCPTSDERRPEPLRRNIPGTVLGRRRRSARPSCDAQIDELKGNPLTETRHLAKAIIEGGSGREMPRGGAQDDPTLGHVACLTRFVARGTKRSPARSAHRGVRALINLRKRSSKSDERQPSPRRSQAARAHLSPLLHHSQGLSSAAASRFRLYRRHVFVHTSPYRTWGVKKVGSQGFPGDGVSFHGTGPAVAFRKTKSGRCAK